MIRAWVRVVRSGAVPAEMFRVTFCAVVVRLRRLIVTVELPVVGMDVVEVAPPYDHADITAALANRVVLEALSGIARRRYDAEHGTTWDPSQPLLANRRRPQA